MELFYTVLILLLVVALSGAVLRMLPFKLPLPLVQIGLGALLALPPFAMKVAFDPELFFVLFIPPLLFADGRRMPRRDLIAMRGPILGLALGLVLVTVLGVGYLVHAMIPAVPLAAAFALAAVLSPTDAVAVGAITGGKPMPPRLLRTLEGEALMNDASGLVTFQFAVAAVLTGSFSLGEAALRFVWIALGGLLTGFAATWLFAHARRALARVSGEFDPPSHIVLILLLPFAAYLLAERMGVSGILSAVAAGLTLNYRGPLAKNLPPLATRMQGSNVWGMLEFVFNGIIFLLLGLQLPGILGHASRYAADAGGVPAWRLAGYVTAIALALILLRFAWAWLILRVLRRRQVRRYNAKRIGTRLLWVLALAGVRGAITLAGILSLPQALFDGAPFPARALLVFLAAAVILCTLIAGAVALPWLLAGLRLPDEDPRVQEEREAREQLAERAIQAIGERIADMGRDDAEVASHATQVASRVIEEYQQQLHAIAAEDGEERRRARHDAALERELRRAALAAERLELKTLHRARRIDETLQRRLLDELDLAEIALGGGRASGS